MLTLADHFRRFRVLFALKVTLASIVCALIGFVFHLSYGYLAPVIIAMIFVAFRDQVVKAGFPAFFAILVAGVVSLLLCGVLIEAPVALVMCMLGWLFLWTAFLGRGPFGRVLGGIVIAMTLLTVAIGSARPEDLITAFWTQAFIAVVVAAFFDRFTWRTSPANAVQETLAAVFGDFARVAQALAERLREKSGDPRALTVELSNIADVSGLLRHTLRSAFGAEFELKFRLWLVWDRTQVIKRQLSKEAFAGLPDTFTSDVADIVADFAWHFGELAEAALHGRRAENVGDDTRRKLENLVDSLREVRFREGEKTEASVLAATLIKFMNHALTDHMRLADAYNAVLESGFDGKAKPERAAFSLSDLFAWPTADDYKTSAKTTLIILILLVGILYLDFPGSSLLAFYAILFGLTVNLGQLYFKGGSGLLGVLVCLTYGLFGVLVIMQSPHLPILLGLYALGMFVAVYVAAGRETMMFMGLQAALLVPYVFVIFEGPEWTLSNAITRVAALVVAAVVAVLVQTSIWPVDPLMKFRQATARALEDLAVSWRQVWQTGESGAVDVPTAVPQFPEALIQSFCQPAAWLKDSRYLVGSGHIAAKRYAPMLGYLEEMLAELNLLDRLLRSIKDETLRGRVNDHLGDTVVTIAEAFEVLAAHYRNPRHARELVDLQTRLAHLQDISSRRLEIDGSSLGASVEERRTVSVVVHTIADLAGSLASAVTATVELSPFKGRRRGRAPAPSQLASTEI